MNWFTISLRMKNIALASSPSELTSITSKRGRNELIQYKFANYEYCSSRPVCVVLLSSLALLNTSKRCRNLFVIDSLSVCEWKILLWHTALLSSLAFNLHPNDAEMNWFNISLRMKNIALAHSPSELTSITSKRCRNEFCQNKSEGPLLSQRAFRCRKNSEGPLLSQRCSVNHTIVPPQKGLEGSFAKFLS